MRTVIYNIDKLGVYHYVEIIMIIYKWQHCVKPITKHLLSKIQKVSISVLFTINYRQNRGALYHHVHLTLLNVNECGIYQIKWQT